MKIRINTAMLWLIATIGCVHADVVFVRIPAYEYAYTDATSGLTTRVYVSPFEMADAAISQAEFRDVMGYNPSHFKGDDLPVHNVSWLEAIRYCNKKSLMDGLQPCYNLDTGTCDFERNGYRLPTEAEYDAAICGARRGRALLEVAHLWDQTDKSMDAVASRLTLGPAANRSLQPFESGVYDVMGNVWEWTYNYFVPAYETAVVQINPVGPSTGFERGIRGGSWMTPYRYGFSVRRFAASLWPEQKRPTVGFRICRSLLPIEQVYNPDPEKFDDLVYANPEDLANASLRITDAQGRTIETQKDWQTRKTQIKAKWLNYLRSPDYDMTGFQTKTIASYQEPLYQLDILLLDASPDQWYKIAILRPERPICTPTPVVLVPFYDIDSSIGKPLFGRRAHPSGVRSYAHLAAAQGYVAVAIKWYSEYFPDYIESVAKMRQRYPDTRALGKWLAVSRRIVDYICTLPNIDQDRIGIIGHSLGAKLSLFSAAFDERISVVAVSEPGIGLEFSNYHDLWYLGDQDSRRDDIDLHQLVAMTAPRPFLLIAGDDTDNENSLDYLNAAAAIYRLYDRRNGLGFYNHRAGHSPTPESVELAFEWINRTLLY